MGAIEYVDPKDVKAAKYNPPTRTDHNNPRFRTLLGAIKKAGEIYQPALVNEKNELVDGHRRREAANLLGMKLPIIRVDTTKHAKDDMFEMVNTTVSKLTPLDELYIHLEGGKISRKTMGIIEKIEYYMDRPFLKEIVKIQQSPVSYIGALSHAANYLGDTSNKFAVQVLKHVHKHRSAFQIKSAVRESIPPAKLKYAITRDKPLKRTWVTDRD